MNTAQLENYAPKARKDFIEAIKARAARFGISESEPVEMMVRDDVAMIYGEAYTWFNRLMALRYMELHGFLDHGYRVLSHPDGDSTPEILQHARHVELPDLDQARGVKQTLYSLDLIRGHRGPFFGRGLVGLIY